jgi:hypothetical protein
MSHETLRSHHVAEDLAQERLSQALRSLPARIPPAGLTTNLRVIASRERQRFQERRTPGRALAAWYERASLSMGQMMRSFVLPIAGGVFTTVILFSTWLVPTYPLHAQSDADVPTMLTTEASVHAAELSLSGGDAEVDVTVDDQGSVVGYDLVTGGDALQDPERLQRLRSELPLLRFTPATAFGRPTASKVRLRLSQIDPSPKGAYVVFVRD